MSGTPENSAISTVVKRHQKDGLTSEVVKEIMGLPADTPDNAKVNNDDFEQKYQDWKAKGGTAQPDPAVAAYQAWEDETITERAPNAHEVIYTRPHSQNPKVLMIRFHPCAGEPRWITERAAELRGRHKTWPFYLLSEALENEGLVLITKIAGCPKVDVQCTICKDPLFANERAWRDYLREDVLERIIMDQLSADSIRWRRDHVACWKFRNWKNNYKAAKLQLESQLKLKKQDGEERELAVKQLNETWARKGHGLAGWLRFQGHITRAETDQLRATIDQITNTKTTNTNNERT